MADLKILIPDFYYLSGFYSPSFYLPSFYSPIVVSPRFPQPMQDIQAILDNHVLIIALLACLMAQVLKLLFELVRHGKVTVRTLVGTGGMPSSHSALVTALATGVGQTLGWASSEFALAFVFAIIVMYDAAGVRQAAGKQARILNQIIDEFFQENATFNEDRLKELLGHTPIQVFAGSALGIAVSWIASPAY